MPLISHFMSQYPFCFISALSTYVKYKQKFKAKTLLKKLNFEPKSVTDKMYTIGQMCVPIHKSLSWQKT